jgi:hypothetical protein
MLASCTAERFVALDVHKHYVVVGAVNVGQQVVLSPRRVDLDEFLSWSQQHLHSTDAVVLEAITRGLRNEISSSKEESKGTPDLASEQRSRSVLLIALEQCKQSGQARHH